MTLEKIKTLIRNADMCVLATTGRDGPHSSLMGFICSADVAEIYLVTARTSLKFRNLSMEPRVSLLVDTREVDPRGEIRAVTITGRAHEIEDAGQKAELLVRIAQQLPHLRALASQPDIALMAVRVQALQLLDGVHDAQYFHLSV